MRKSVIGLCAALALLWSSGAEAITLNECLNEVLVTNPKVLEKLKYYNAVVHDRSVVNSGRNVRVDLQADGGWQEISNSNTKYHAKSSDVVGARVVARKLLADGKKLDYDVASREANARSALFSYVDAANNLAWETAEAYINVLKTKELLYLALENVEIHAQLMKSIGARVEAKTSGKSELERVKGRLASAQAVLIVRQNDYKKAIYQLHKVMGRFIDGSELHLPVLAGAQLPVSLSVALEKQWKSHPLLIAADYNLNAREQELRREKVDNHPDLYLEAARDWRKNFSGLRAEDNDSTVMLRLNVPLYDGHHARYRIAQHSSLLHREKHLRDNVARSVLNDLQLTYTGYKLIHSQIGALRKSIFFTRQALRSYQQEFKLGKRLLINILDAEVEYQNARSQLAALQSDLLLAKFRLLYSMGAMLEDIGIEIPLAAELAAAKRARPASDDRVPLLTDLDKDGVEDKIDVSVNSLKEQVVNKFGETQEMTLAFLEEPVKASLSDEIIAIKERADLQLQSIKPDIPTILGFVTFAPVSEELSQQAKVLMREVLPQLKRLANDGQIKITVTEGDRSLNADAHLLALRRAYNLKKILVMHLLDAEGITVEARAANSNEEKNAMLLTVQTEASSFSDQIEVLKSRPLKFSDKTTLITKETEDILCEVVTRLKSIPTASIDVVGYANDFENPTANKYLGLRRAEAIKNTLRKLGADNAIISSIGWGDYEDYSDLYSAMEETSGKNRIEFVVRNNEATAP